MPPVRLSVRPCVPPRFFTRVERWRGIVTFLGGIVLVIVGWPVVGIFVQLFGFLNLFASFFPVALAFLRHMPVIGSVFNAPVVSKVMDKLAGVSAKRRPPV